MINKLRLFGNYNLYSVTVRTSRNITEMTTKKVEDMRISYDVSSLEDDNLPAKDPFKLFHIWFQEAVAHPSVVEANAMNLATSSKDGFPTARIVLLKGVTEGGFRFFTNHGSQKGRQLMQNPRAAITFYWEPLQKQVRINGNVEQLSHDQSEEYFHKRPIENQIGSTLSCQSSVVESRKFLEEAEAALMKKYEGKSQIPLPEYWGGFLLIPDTIEFWCGGHGRLHDRIRFRRKQPNETLDLTLTKQGDNGWLYERLSP